MLAQHLGELGKAAWILVFVGLARGAVGIDRRGDFDALFGKHLAGLARLLAAFLDQFGIGAGAVAAARSRDRNAAFGVMNADMQRGGRAHRVADHMGFVDFQRVHDRDDVVPGDILAVFVAILGDVGRRITALAVGDAAMGAREMPHLRLPRAVVAGIFMHEDDRRPLAVFLARLFVVQTGAIPRGNMRHRVLQQSELNYLHTYESRVKSRREDQLLYLFRLGPMAQVRSKKIIAATTAPEIQGEV